MHKAGVVSAFDHAPHCADNQCVALQDRRGAAARRAWSRLLHHRCGVVALEFALAALPMLLMVLGIFELSFDLFVQSALDTAVSVAGRAVQVGAVQGSSGETSSQFAAAALCPTLSKLLSCSLVTVAVAPVVTGYDYYSNPSALSLTTAASAGGSICTGSSGKLMLIMAWYTGPAFVGGLIPSFATTYKGARVHITTASAGFVNEAFSGGQTTGVGC